MSLLALVLACASVCDPHRDEAVDRVLAVTDAFTSCEVAADCHVVWIAGDCFDVCSRIVGIDGVGATATAIAAANEEVCADVPFCEAERPPCVPPGESRCVDHVCTEE